MRLMVCLKHKPTHDEAAYAAYQRYCASIDVEPATYASWLKLTTRLSAVNWLGKDDTEHRPLQHGRAHKGRYYTPDLAYATA
jgi:hypothetical protein